MSTYNTILVPLDGSEFGEQALPLARAIAREHRARIELAHVHQLVFVEGQVTLPDFERELREQETDYLQRLGEGLSRELNGSVHGQLLDGATVPALCEHASDARADLVVLTTHGRGGIERLWLGSVTDSLIRQLNIPVLVIRPNGEALGWEPKTHPRRVVVPLDGSQLSERILEHAMALGHADETRYLLVQVVPPWRSFGGPALPVDQNRLREISIKAATAELREAARRVETEGFQVDTEVLVDPSPAGAVLEYARKVHADLIAMTTHGRGGVRRMMLGSVADKVIRAASIPVLLLRPPE